MALIQVRARERAGLRVVAVREGGERVEVYPARVALAAELARHEFRRRGWRWPPAVEVEVSSIAARLPSAQTIASAVVAQVGR